MVDGKINIKLSLKSVANELAELAGSKETIHHDEMTGSYFINNVDESMLEQNGFKFFEYSFNKTPIYKREDVFAMVHSDPAFGNVQVYKEGSTTLNFREE